MHKLPKNVFILYIVSVKVTQILIGLRLLKCVEPMFSEFNIGTNINVKLFNEYLQK